MSTAGDDQQPEGIHGGRKHRYAGCEAGCDGTRSVVNVVCPEGLLFATSSGRIVRRSNFQPL